MSKGSGRPTGGAAAGTAAQRKAKVQAAGSTSSSGPSRVMVAAVVLVVAIIAVVVVVVLNGRSDKPSGTAVPTGAAGMGAVWVDPASRGVTGKPVVTVYEDFRCPVCKLVEAGVGPVLRRLADEKAIELRYGFKTVIDSKVGGHSSRTAASDALCAADQGAYPAYHEQLFANQPEEPNPYTDAELNALAPKAGLSGTQLQAWQRCADAGTYDAYVASVEDTSFQAGVTGTPAIYLGGTPVNWGAYTDQTGSSWDTTGFEQLLRSGTVPADRVENSLPTLKD